MFDLVQLRTIILLTEWFVMKNIIFIGFIVIAIFAVGCTEQGSTNTISSNNITQSPIVIETPMVSNFTIQKNITSIDNSILLNPSMMSNETINNTVGDSEILPYCTDDQEDQIMKYNINYQFGYSQIPVKPYCKHRTSPYQTMNKSTTFIVRR
jgi:hypothetical protein